MFRIRDAFIWKRVPEIVHFVVGGFDPPVTPSLMSHPYEDAVEPGPVAEAGVLRRLRPGQLQVAGPHVHREAVPLPPVWPPVAAAPRRPARSLQTGYVVVGELLSGWELLAQHLQTAFSADGGQDWGFKASFPSFLHIQILLK